MKAIMDFFAFWIGMRTRFDRYRNEGKAETSVAFGILSICYSLFGCALLALFVWLASLLLLQTDGLTPLLAVPFAVILGILALVVAVRGPIAGLVAAVYQLRLNKKPIGWIALAVWFLALAAAVVAALWVLGMFGDMGK